MKIKQVPIRINDIFENAGSLDIALTAISKMLSLQSLTKVAGGEKRSGHSVSKLLYISLFLQPLSGCRGSILSFFKRLASDQQNVSPALYRFLRNTEVNWRKVHMSINAVMRTHFKKSFAKEEPTLPRVFIADDTALIKSGRKIKGISHIHDHTDNRYKHGFKMLGMMYFNGFYAHFVDFS